MDRLPPLFGVYRGSPVSPAMGYTPGAPYGASLFYHLLPYVEAQPVHSLLPPYFDFGPPQQTVAVAGDPIFAWAGALNTPEGNAAAFAIPVYLCPSEKSGPSSGLQRQGTQDWGLANYAANWLVFGARGAPYPAALAGAARLPGSVPDGLSNTIFFTEKYAMCRRTINPNPASGENRWSYPPAFPNTRTTYGAAVGVPSTLTDFPDFAYLDLFQLQPVAGQCNPYQAQSPHIGGINVALGDGSVRLVHTGISRTTWKAAFTPDGGEVLGFDWNE